MKITDIDRMYTVTHHPRRNDPYVALLWDKHTRIAQGTTALHCRNEAVAVIRAAQGCEFVGTLSTQVKAINNDTSGNPRVAYIAYLHLTNASVSPLSDAPPDRTLSTQSAKADRGYEGVEQPVYDAAEWARREFKRHSLGKLAGSEVVFVVNPLRHHPDELSSRATPPNPVSGSYVEQSYLVYAVPAGVKCASKAPRLTEHYYHTFRRAVAYRKSVAALEKALLSHPVEDANDLSTLKVRDTYRTNIVVTIAPEN